MQNCEIYMGHTRADLGIVSPRMCKSITFVPWNPSTLVPPCTAQIHPYPRPMPWTSERDTSGTQEQPSPEAKRTFKHCSPLLGKAKSSPSYSLTPSPLISHAVFWQSLILGKSTLSSCLKVACLCLLQFLVQSQNLPHPQCLKMTFTFLLCLSLDISASSTSI